MTLEGLEIIQRIPLGGDRFGIITGDGRHLVHVEKDVPWRDDDLVRQPTEQEWREMVAPLSARRTYPAR